VAPNFCANCGEKVIPEKKFCPNCGVSLATTSSNIVKNGAAYTIGFAGGVFGAIIGIGFLLAFFSNLSDFFASSSKNTLGFILAGLASFGFLAFSILGAFGAAQKLDARLTVNVRGLFLAGVGFLLCTLYVTIIAAANPATSNGALLFFFIGLFISVLFFLSSYEFFRKPI